MDITTFEEQNGVRVSSFVWPTNQLDAQTISLPIGCTYTPLKQINGREEPLQYPPLECPRCRAVLNPYCNVDYTGMKWTCNFCGATTPFPSAYQGMTPETPLTELLKDCTTVEYQIQQPAFEKPVFIFVVDICSTEKEHGYLKTILLQTIAALPQDAMVGLITFGTTCAIKELVFSECPRDYIFNGNKTYTAQQMQQFLSYYPKPGETKNNFILPISEAEQMLNVLLDGLERDQFTVQKGDRAARCTGAALSHAVNLLQAILPGWGGHILLFTSGPITKGPGAIASIKRAEPIRQHREIETGKAQYCEKAKEFFQQLGEEASASNIVIDFISAGFEESGVHEISSAVLHTGGFLLSCETWNDESISQSLIMFFSSGMLNHSGIDANIQVQCSHGINVRGCIGPCVSCKRKAPFVSEKVIGEGGTDQWHTAGLFPDTTFAVYFDVAALKNAPLNVGQQSFIQFMTKYRNVIDGTRRIRVTTFPIVFADYPSQKERIISSIDEQAATVLLAKLCVYKTRSEKLNDVVRFLDKTLIDTCRAFGSFNKGKPNSLQLPQQLSIYPRFLYHFRRSSFMSTFNSAPDQTMTLRLSMLLEDVNSCLLMIQPMLKSYPVNSTEPLYVPLEMSSLAPNTSLFLDTYFRTLVWYGKDVAAWRDQGLQDTPEYANVKRSIEEPLAEAKAVHDERFPAPQLITCDQDSSLSRYLLARCNPVTVEYALESGETLISDEPSFEKFFNKLKPDIVK